jgi:hypothetical protein
MAVFRKRTSCAFHLVFRKFFSTEGALLHIGLCHIEKSKCQSSNVKSMTNDLMSKYFCSFGFWISFEIWSLTFDIIFLQDYTPKYFIKKFSTPPTPKAIGKITADIHRVFLNPLSFIIIKNWAMQGIKRVRVTKLTRIW